MHTAPIKYLMTRKGDLVVSSAIQPKTRPNDRSMSSRQSNALKKKQKKNIGFGWLPVGVLGIPFFIFPQNSGKGSQGSV